MLQCAVGVAACCSVLKVLQYVAVCYRCCCVLQCAIVRSSVRQREAVCFRMHFCSAISV